MVLILKSDKNIHSRAKQEKFSNFSGNFYEKISFWKVKGGDYHLNPPSLVKSAMKVLERSPEENFVCMLSCSEKFSDATVKSGLRSHWLSDVNYHFLGNC